MLGDTYAPTTYQRFCPNVTIKLTTFVPNLRVPSTYRTSSSLQTMAIPTWFRLYNSVTHTLYPEINHVWMPPEIFVSCNTPILMLPCRSARSAVSNPPDRPDLILSNTMQILCPLSVYLGTLSNGLSSPCAYVLWF